MSSKNGIFSRTSILQLLSKTSKLCIRRVKYHVEIFLDVQKGHTSTSKRTSSVNTQHLSPTLYSKGNCWFEYNDITKSDLRGPHDL